MSDSLTRLSIENPVADLLVAYEKYYVRPTLTHLRGKLGRDRNVYVKPSSTRVVRSAHSMNYGSANNGLRRYGYDSVRPFSPVGRL